MGLVDTGLVHGRPRSLSLFPPSAFDKATKSVLTELKKNLPSAR